MLRWLKAALPVIFVLLSSIPAQGARNAQALTGQWKGLVVVRPAEYEVDFALQVDGGQGGALKGWISYPTQDIKEQPLESLSMGEDGEVSFASKDQDGVVSSFKGWLSSDGETIKGDLAEQGQHYLFELHRGGGEPLLASPPGARVEMISSQGEELLSAFNRDHDHVRLLLILSPSCPMCRNGAGLVQRYVLDKLRTDDLRVYVVWEAVSAADTEARAKEAAVFIADPRVRQFWSKDQVAGKAFQSALGVKDAPPFDVFLVFAPAREWRQGAPPAIDFFMHNLAVREGLPQDKRLNGITLAGEIETLLAKSPKSSSPAIQARVP